MPCTLPNMHERSGSLLPKVPADGKPISATLESPNLWTCCRRIMLRKFLFHVWKATTSHNPCSHRPQWTQTPASKPLLLPPPPDFSGLKSSWVSSSSSIGSFYLQANACKIQIWDLLSMCTISPQELMTNAIQASLRAAQSFAFKSPRCLAVALFFWVLWRILGQDIFWRSMPEFTVDISNQLSEGTSRFPTLRWRSFRVGPAWCRKMKKIQIYPMFALCILKKIMCSHWMFKLNVQTKTYA